MYGYWVYGSILFGGNAELFATFNAQPAPVGSFIPSVLKSSSAVFSTSPSISLAGNKIGSSSVTFAGVGSLQAGTSRTANFSGTASMSLTPNVIHSGTVAFSGAASLVSVLVKVALPPPSGLDITIQQGPRKGI